MILSRNMLKQLQQQSNERKISLLIGPRQVGKTTLLKALHEELSKTHKCLFLDVDILSNYEKMSTFENAVNTLKLNGYDEQQKEFFYVFLDEFQKHSFLVTIMKNIYDSFENVKIYASGSSSLAIKQRAQESLAGRKRINELFPLDFEEFLWFKQDTKLIEQFASAKKLKGDKLNQVLKDLQRALEEFIVYGGYPEVVLRRDAKEKVAVLDSIFDLYVKKDLVDYLKVDKILHVKKLIEFLAVNNGQKIKYEALAQFTHLRYVEIKQYLDILEETGIVHVLTPFFTNKTKELVKIPKIYFIDNGVRNYFIGNFNELSLRNDAGFLFEGFVIAELLKQECETLSFWQDKNRNEVDFVLEIGGRQIPLEVKYKTKLASDDLVGLRTFLKKYPKTKKAYLVNLASQKTGTIMHLLPYSLDTLSLD